MGKKKPAKKKAERPRCLVIYDEMAEFMKLVDSAQPYINKANEASRLVQNDPDDIARFNGQDDLISRLNSPDDFIARVNSIDPESLKNKEVKKPNGTRRRRGP